MTRLLIISVLVGLAAACNERVEPINELPTEEPGEHIQISPADVPWQDGPPSLPPGSQYAVLEGSPGEQETFSMRLRLPDGYRIPPHWHPNVERLTILSGTFHLGEGEAFDETAMTALVTGSYSRLPPGMRHFALVQGETVVQLTSIGPWEINYVDPADDPR